MRDGVIDLLTPDINKRKYVLVQMIGTRELRSQKHAKEHCVLLPTALTILSHLHIHTLFLYCSIMTYSKRRSGQQSDAILYDPVSVRSILTFFLPRSASLVMFWVGNR